MKLLATLPAWAAAAWSAGYGALAVLWWTGGGTYPFAPIDNDHRSASILEGTSSAVVAPIMAVVCLAATAVAVYLARGGRHRAALVFGWTLAAVLALLLPDYTLLAFLAFGPLLIVFAFTGVPGPQDGIGDIMYWHRTNLLILFAGGLLWAAATLVAARRARHACLRCGRRPSSVTAPPEDLLRWGRRAVWVAVLAPVPYEVTRIAWFFGLPLGIQRDFLRMMQDTPGMLEIGLGCAVASIGGGILTHGLVHRWGEVFPRWTLWLSGRRVPPMPAVIPALLVAVVLIPAGLMNLRFPVTGGTWAVTAPGVLWTVWGAALGVAAITYHLRRRPPCHRCGRPLPAPQPEGPQPASAQAGAAASGT